MKIKINRDLNSFRQFKCKDLFTGSCGHTPRKENDNYNGEVPWVNISDLGEKYITKTKKTILDTSKIVEANSLLISFKLSVGVRSINKIPVSTNEAILRIEPSKLKTDIDIYDLYYILPNEFLKNCGKNAYGANILNTKMINDIDIKIPNGIKKITKTLLNFDNRIEKIKTLLEKIEIRNQYYADKLLSGELSIGEDGKISNNKEVFDTFKLNDILQLINGHPFGSKDMKNEGTYPIIKMSNFKNGVVNINIGVKTDIFVDKAALLKNDLLIGLSGSVGEYAFLKSDTICLLNQRCLAIRSKDSLGEYAKKYIIKKMLIKLKNESEGGVIKNISANFFNGVDIKIPKNYLLVNNFLDKLDNEKSKVERLLKLEEKRFEWLSDKLLSGEYTIED